MPTNDRRPALYASYELAARVVTAVGDQDLSKPTPCPEYDVATLVDHLVGAADRAVAVGRGEAPAPEEFPHVQLADAPELLRQSGRAAEVAWSDDSRLEATVTMPWGETYTGETLVDMYLAELAAHSWDVAVSTGQGGELGPEIAGPALEGARAMLKPEYRDLMGKGNPFGPEVAPPEDATGWELFAAFMGRPPRLTDFAEA
jgi:uncharacterized protein (TIGR03086 family)